MPSYQRGGSAGSGGHRGRGGGGHQHQHHEQRNHSNGRIKLIHILRLTFYLF